MNYKYNIGDTVQFKHEFHPSASCSLKKLAGKVVTIIDRRYYENPCYKFKGLEEEGWFTESTFTGIVTNPYVIFAGGSRDDLEPIESASDRGSAITAATKLQDQYPFVEVTFMPEDDEEVNEVVYAHYTEEDCMVTRKTTNRILEMAEEGMVSWQDLAFMALKWMSEDDVASMLKANEIFMDEEDEE